MPLTEVQEQKVWMVAFGVLGGLLRLAVMEDKHLTPMEAISTAVAGAVVAVVASPYLNRLIPGNPSETLALISFIMGLSGMAICKAVVVAANRRSEGVINGVLDKTVGEEAKKKKSVDVIEKVEVTEPIPDVVEGEVK